MFRGHKRSVRGFRLITYNDEQRHRNRKREVLLSWDVKGILLWDGETTFKQLKFPKSQQNFINSMIFIPKLKILFAAALDMTFRMYDLNFKLLESIHHDERVVVHCEYDAAKDFIIIAGATGVSVWKIYRCTGTSMTHVMERMYCFAGLNEWVTRFVYEPQHRRAYALCEQSVYILNFRTRSVETTLRDIHDAPVTCCLWYLKDQFYITACSRGVLRCWSPHRSLQQRMHSSEEFSMVYSVQAHAKAVTGLALHPQPGMLLTASMDMSIKIFSLEAFQLLQFIQTPDIVANFMLTTYHNMNCCLFSNSNGDITVWKIDSYCSLYMSCATDIVSLNNFETIQGRADEDIVYVEDSSTVDNANYRFTPDIADRASPETDVLRSRLSSVNTDTSLAEMSELTTPNTDAVQIPIAPMSLDAPESVATKAPMNVVVHAGSDIRLVSESGSPLSRLEPELVVDGVRAFVYSAYQKLLFCILESGVIRSFCTRLANSNTLRDFTVGAKGDIAESIVLIDVMSLTSLRSSATSKTVRGEPSPLNVDETLVVGTSSGSLVFMDTFQECGVINAVQAFHGSITSLKYRKSRRELLALGLSISESAATLKVWKVPEMILQHEIKCDVAMRCWSISPTLNFVGIGCSDGYCRLLSLISDKKTTENKKTAEKSCKDTGPVGSYIEVLRQEHQHEREIIDIAFCDSLRVFATTAQDYTVKFWDYEKRYIRTIVFDVLSRSLLFTHAGDLLLAQNMNIFRVEFHVWEGRGLIQQAVMRELPWDVEFIEHTSSDVDVVTPRISLIQRGYKQETFLTEASKYHAKETYVSSTRNSRSSSFAAPPSERIPFNVRKPKHRLTEWKRKERLIVSRGQPMPNKDFGVTEKSQDIDIIETDPVDVDVATDSSDRSEVLLDIRRCTIQQAIEKRQSLMRSTVVANTVASTVGNRPAKRMAFIAEPIKEQEEIEDSHSKAIAAVVQRKSENTVPSAPKHPISSEGRKAYFGGVRTSRIIKLDRRHTNLDI